MNRVYNGCPDDELQKRLDKLVETEEKLKQLYPEAHVTYFPMEELYQVWQWNNPLGKSYPSKMDAMMDALKKYEKENK